MEMFIILGLMCLVVAVKGLTTLWIGHSRKAIREAEGEEADVLHKLEAVESAKLQLEREKEAVDREEKLMENDRDLVCMEIGKLGVEPIPEDEIDAIDARAEITAARKPQAPPSEGEAGETDDSSPAPSEGEGPESAEESGPSRVRILVVDDNAELRELLQQVLSRSYDVVSAADGYEALTKIKKEKQVFDLIVTDLKMPNIDGITFVEHLPKPVPTIIISGFLQRPDFREAVGRLSPVAVFEKPFKLAAVRKAIEGALKGEG